MHHKRMVVSFWRHKSKRAGYSQLYCRIQVAGVQKDIGSTGITVVDAHWDGRQVTEADLQAFYKNEQLLIMHDQLLAIYNDLLRSRQIITADKIKRAYQNQGKAHLAMTTVFELYLRDSAADPERKLSPETVKVYDRVRKKLVDFLIHEKALDLPAEDFDVLWAKKFRRWMASVPHKTGTGHAESYIIKQSQTIKDVLIWAKLNKHISSNPLEGMKLKGVEYGDPVFLTEVQFQRLRRHRFDNPVLQQCADVLVILCRSGFHYGDLVDFVKHHDTAVRTGLDGKVWLMKDRIKTEVAIRVPQFKEVKAIVDKYGGWDKLPIRPLTKFNLYLKVIAAELRLPAALSSKAGRKTFTDWCYNELHLSTDAVKVVLGRKSDKGLEVYGRPDERRVIAELKESKGLKKPRKEKAKAA